MARIWTPEEIGDLVTRNNVAVEHGILRLFERQTASEQASETTHLHNNVGFSAFEAKSASYMARWLLSSKHLSGTWLEKARKICFRHRKQLCEIANNKNS